MNAMKTNHYDWAEEYGNEAERHWNEWYYKEKLDNEISQA